MSAANLAADLAGRFGLRKRARSWGGNCPSCSYHAAFSIKVGRNADRPLLFCANGCTREQLDGVAVQALGSAWTPPPPVAQATVEEARAKKQAAAIRLWNGSGPVPGTPAEIYLARRGLSQLAQSPVLRFRPDCWHVDQARCPALIARVQNATGETVAVHRTYLAADGRKAALDPPKASLGPVWTGAIRLDAAAPDMVVGEGIETAASAGQLLGLPAWAAINAGNMAAALVLPPEVRSIVVAADHDGPGRAAAVGAGRRWRAEGRAVRIATPDKHGQDFNDVLLERAHA